MSYESDHPLIPRRHDTLHRINQEHPDTKDYRRITEEAAYTRSSILALKEDGFKWWGHHDTWLRKSEGGYTMYAVSKTDDAFKEKARVNMFLVPIDEALEKYIPNEQK
tara:strand:- start:1461 stop:1784 length:324 start_codon:yes stop_codon:yes gene_type:complete